MRSVCSLVYELVRLFKHLIWRNKFNLSLSNEFLKLINPHLKSLPEISKANTLIKSHDLLHDGNSATFQNKCEIHLRERHINSAAFLLLGHEFTNSIGHMSLGLATRIHLNKLDKSSQFDAAILYCKSANEHLLEKYFSNYFTLVKVECFTYEILRFFQSRLFEEVAYITTRSGPIELYHAQELIAKSNSLLERSEWNNFGQIFTLSKEDVVYCKSLLTSWGLDPEKPFIVIHLKKEETEQGLRGSKFSNYELLINYLIGSGKNVIYFGDDRQGIEKVKDLKGFVDYQKMQNRSSRGDVVLLGGCSFAVVSTSGPMNVPGLFGIPLLWTNAIGLSRFLHHYNCNFVPKVFYENGNLVSLKSMLEEPKLFFVDYLNQELLREFGERKIEVVENGEQEILDAFIELEMKSEMKLMPESSLTLDYIMGKKTSTLSESFSESYPKWLD